jgi:lipopolysaccharide heptosyltransferase I
MVKVLVVKPSSLGDILHAAPAVELLSSGHPERRLTWLTNEEYVDFVKDLPGVSEVIGFPRGRFRWRRFPRWLPEAISWSKALSRGFDVAIDFQGLQRSGLMASLSGAGERFGFGDARELAWLHYTHRVEVPQATLHAVDRNLLLARKACSTSSQLRGVEKHPAEPVDDHDFALGWRLAIPAPALSFAAVALESRPCPPVALCPGTRWESKRWPVRRWAELIDALSREKDLPRPILLGGAGDSEEAAAILKLASAPAESFVGRVTLWQTAALLKHCAAAVAVDSANLHLAASLGIPSVSLFGPTDPARVAPRGSQHRVLQRQDLECNGCYRRSCPLPRRLCLPETPAEAVVAALKGFCLKGR